MQGRAFLDVAREVVKGTTEAHWRAGIIHAYYALFLECRDALTRWGVAVPAYQKGHSAVRLRFVYAANADLKSIDGMLDKWCRFRNQANYDLSALSKFVTDAFAHDAIRETTTALALLDAIDAKAIPRADVNSYTIRQLQALKSPEVAAKLTKIIGEIRPASQEKAKLMAKYKAELKPDILKKANLSNGRALYAKTCVNCHRLFGEGGDIGPDLTGSQRTNLDYVLENVLDPSAIVPKEYQVTVVVTKAGRTLSGLVKKESDQALTLQLPNEVVVVPKGDIDTRTPTKVSMMPDGLFEQMRLEEVRDLVGYLASPSQVLLKK